MRDTIISYDSDPNFYV